MQPAGIGAPQATPIRGHSQERLQYRSLSLEVQIQDRHGRTATLSFEREQLSFQGSYDRHGRIAGSAPRGQADSLLDRVRAMVGETALGQARSADRGAVVHQRQEVALSYERTQLTVSGDAQLAQDHFGVAATADRIVDFVDGLLRRAGVTADDPTFGDLVAEARDGVRQGFAAAAELLGGLPEIAEQTQRVVETMLARLIADPSAPRDDAASILQAWRDAEAEGHQG